MVLAMCLQYDILSNIYSVLLNGIVKVLSTVPVINKCVIPSWIGIQNSRCFANGEIIQN